MLIVIKSDTYIQKANYQFRLCIVYRGSCPIAYSESLSCAGSKCTGLHYCTLLLLEYEPALLLRLFLKKSKGFIYALSYKLEASLIIQLTLNCSIRFIISCSVHAILESIKQVIRYESEAKKKQTISRSCIENSFVESRVLNSGNNYKNNY